MWYIDRKKLLKLENESKEKNFETKNEMNLRQRIYKECKIKMQEKNKTQLENKIKMQEQNKINFVLGKKIQEKNKNNFKLDNKVKYTCIFLLSLYIFIVYIK